MTPVFNVIGLDISLTCTGWCYLAEDDYTTGTIKTTPKDGIIQERVKIILKSLQSVLNTVKKCQEIDLIAIEGYSFGVGKNASRAFDLAEVSGAVKLYLYKMGIPYVLIPPNTLKKFLTGSGRAKKNEMLKAAYKRFDVDVKTDDEADAFGLAMMGACLVCWKDAATLLKRKTDYDSMKNWLKKNKFSPAGTYELES